MDLTATVGAINITATADDITISAPAAAGTISLSAIQGDIKISTNVLDLAIPTTAPTANTDVVWATPTGIGGVKQNTFMVAALNGNVIYIPYLTSVA
jgi:hypothetical protein